MASEYPENSWGSYSGGSSEIPGSSSEIRCEVYPGIRVRGPRGKWEQVYPEILGKQEKEVVIDECSMATWVCGVIVIKRENEPCHTSLPFVDILSNSTICTGFLVCGELSDKGVHHTHFLCRTNSRLDSVRRAILNAQQRSDFDFDVCKLATCRYWLGMFSYLLKNPLMVFASDNKLASLAFTVIEDGSTLRYLKAPEQQERGKDVVQCINGIITEHDCKTIEDVFSHGGSRLVKYLHLSSLSNVISNCLQYVHSRNRNWDPKSFKFAPENDARAIHNILRRQNINVAEFDDYFWKWITRQAGKVNTLILQGPSNTGKSVFVRGLVALARAGSIINTSSPFFAEGICGSNIGIWEEPLLTAENAEMFKLISEGAPMQLPQKFKKPFNHPGCPILITTNHDITRFCDSERGTIMNRCRQFWFNNPVSSTERACSRDCLLRSRDERRSTPCYLNWGQYSGDISGQSGFDRFCSEGGSNSEAFGRRCGRWWCGSNDGRLCRSCSSSSIQRAESGGLGGSASASARGNLGSGGECEAGDSGRSGGRPSRRDAEHLDRRRPFAGPYPDRGDWPNWSSRGGLGRGGIDAGAGQLRGTAEGADAFRGNCGGRLQTTSRASEDAQVEGGETCTCVIEPLPQDWQCYLCFLANKHE